MSKKLIEFLENVVDSTLPVEQQSTVLSMKSIIGGVTSNSGNCSNMNTCKSTDNFGDCTNYISCDNSYNGGSCKQIPYIPIQPPTVAKLCGTA